MYKTKLRDSLKAAMPTFTLIGEYSYSAWASDLGLKPGEFPATYFIEGVGTLTLEHINRDGAHIYRKGASKFTLTIFND